MHQLLTSAMKIWEKEHPGKTFFIVDLASLRMTPVEMPLGSNVTQCVQK